MVNQAVIREALAVAVGQGRPVLLWGHPGTGKSSVVRDLATATNRRLEVVIASLREPSDFAGLPVVDASGHVQLAPPGWAVRLAGADQGLLFLDEISTAAPAVQAALLRVVLERTVGELQLPPAVAVVAAANPPETTSGGWDLTAPLANRFCHLDWPVDPQGYVESLTAGWPEPGLRPLGATSAANARGVAAGFLRARPGLVLAPPADATSSGRAWPSPRSWDAAIELWGAGLTAGCGPDTQMVLVAGCVGPGAATELFAWARSADLPDPEDVLADPQRFRLPDRGDRQFAVLSAITAAVAANPTPERWEAGFTVIKQAVDRGAPDIAAVAARSLARCAPAGLEHLPASLTSLAPVLGRAGLLRRRTSA